MSPYNKQIKRFCKYFLLFLFSADLMFAYAQPYGNEWINYSQQYYKFKVAETGIYRLDSATLAASGIPVGSIDPRNMQIFARGQEIPLYVNGENDGVFNGSDFIEFYGQHNDGWFDEPLYGNAAKHPNPYYSLFNDTIYYYLTWNNSTSNNRFVLETDTSYSSFTPVSYFTKEVVQYYTIGQLTGGAYRYYDGKTQNIGGTAVTLFDFHETEGWFDNYYLLGANKTKSIPTPNAYTLASGATLNAVVLGQSDYSGISSGDQHLRVTLGPNQLDTIFEGYQKIDVRMDIPINDLGAANTSVNFESVNDLGSGAARQAISYITITYPHTLDLEGLSTFDQFDIDNHPTEAKSYMVFSNFNGAGTPIFYDLSNNKRIAVTVAGSSYKCLVPNGAVSEKRCYLSSDAQVLAVGGLTPVEGTGTFTDYISMAIDTAFVIITHPSLMAEANDYATHRMSGPGNNPQNPVLFNINELYDQFAYGVEKHPYAIRGFMDYITDNWPSMPNYLFLLGKSVEMSESRKDSANFHNNLIPSYGIPCSDNRLTAGLNGTFYEPLVPTGRLAANNGLEVSQYLDKVIDHENPNPITGTISDNWMKRILHFGGGSTSGEQQSFANYLNGYKTIIEDTLFGGNVNSYFKNSTAPIQTTISDSIKNFIGQGVALMTFFGHASATGGFDQNIDNPSNWPNQNGRYPFLLGLGCYAGDIHIASANSTSEEYVMIPNQGVIAYLSPVDLGYSATLGAYATEFYKQVSYKDYHGSIGKHIVKAIKSTQNTSLGVEEFRNSTALNITLHGDPSLKLNTFDRPDFMINASTVTFSPAVVTSDLDSFDVDVLVTNLGKAVGDTIILELVRDFPDQNFVDTIYTKSFSATRYQETYSFRLPVDVVRGLGMNNFTVTIDAINAVDESFENNNTVTKSLNILSGEIVPIYPYEFMIVGDQGVTLSASTAFPFEPAKNYLFELDTTDYFNSPITQNTVVNSAGGIVSWTPALLQNMPDSTVYFWRVGKDSVDASGYSWRYRSFQYIRNRGGWQQDHFFQFENDDYQFVKHNRPTRKFDFVNDLKELEVYTYGKADWSELNKIAYYIDGDRMGKNGYGVNTAVHIAVLDSVTLEPWSAVERPFYGHANSSAAFIGSAQEHFFIFRHTASQMAALETFIKDSIPSGNHVLMWSWYIVSLSSFSAPFTTGLRTEFSNIGATQLSTIPDLYPFILYHQKGNVGSTIEVVGDSIDQKDLELKNTLITSANYGNVFSQLLGPAVSWDSLSWRMSALETPSSRDSSVLNVIGVDASGNQTLLIADLPTDSGDIRIANTINAAQYPYLRLNAHLTDDSLLTAPQLDRWQVIFSDVPEAALDPKIHFVLSNDTVQEGEDITLEIAVKNISKFDMDSLLISFAVLDKNNQTNYLPYARQKPLLSDSVLIAKITFSTSSFPGLNTLLVDVNPNNDQLEKYHFNNVAQIPFYAVHDDINPLLDVTFDGIHILDGDIVSPEAEIVIELTDENKFLLLDDTADYAIYITNPAGTEKRIYFTENGQQRMQFIPASLPKNNSKIILQGDFPVDGMYKLRVQASDKANNNSGDLDYIINYEVINASTITNVLNYPNPFTTSTRFIFTLTGSEIPDIFKIQIMTITGKVVREIHKDELGPIHIGRNVTEFAWDGTDTFGDRLANGVYLYHVITQINSQEIDHRDTSADGYFKKGFGKMVLFR
ncbi:MAG: hypothetical protein KDD41_10600 [Flavobacteriales bacterium]|nr:hypothetical protein [Flavobacteriales bacterium]